MAGPWQHPNGVWYFRRELPKDIWDAKERLEQFGISIGGKEVRRSLGTRDRPRALSEYTKVAAEFEAKWESWRGALAHGPHQLTHKATIAIAGAAALTHVARHDDNPQLAPKMFASAPRSTEKPILVSPEEVALIAPDLPRLASASGDQRLAVLNAWPEDDARWAVLAKIVGPHLKAALEAEVGAETDSALSAQALVVGRKDRNRLITYMTAFKGKAQGTLARMNELGDYSPPEWSAGLPEVFTSSSLPKTPFSPITFEEIIDGHLLKRSRGKDAKPIPAATGRKYKSITQQFASYRKGKKGTDATTVTGVELEGWRDELQNAGGQGNRTIHYKVGVIKTILRWGNRLFKGQLAAALAEVTHVELPDFERKPSQLSAMRPSEAVTILSAARKEVDPRLRWIPWLCAYTGLRIAEVSNLEKADFFDSGGHWFFNVSSAGKRSLKTVNARRTVPVHQALLDEGFRTFVDESPNERLFKPGADSALLRWVRGPKVGVTRKDLSPNHGWRHLFEDLCRRDGLTDDARTYLTGHSTGGADQQYGRTEVMLPGLWREMAKIKAFEVDTLRSGA